MADAHGAPTGDLSSYGITPAGEVYWNQDAPTLIELAVARGEGVYSAHKALVTETGERTGRSPNDKFIVDEPSTTGDINWGDVNVSTDAETFVRMRAKVVDTSLRRTHSSFKICIAVRTSAKPSQFESSTTMLGTTPSPETCLFARVKSNFNTTLPNSQCSTHHTSRQALRTD